MSPQLQHTVAAALLEFAYLAAGLILCYFGKDMLEKGLTTGFRADGGAASMKFRVATSSPGLVFMIAGLVVIGTAIRTQALFEQRRETPAAEPQQQQTTDASLTELADRVVISRLAQPSAEQTFAQSQIAAARRHMNAHDTPAALVSLVHAVVVSPGVLKTALDDPDLRTLTADPTFQAIVRQRFKLPLNVTVSQQTTRDRSVLGELGLFAQDRRQGEDVSSLLQQFPSQSEHEPVAATAERLRAVLARNPRALFSFLRAPEHGWMLQNEQLVAELRSAMSQMASVQ